MTQVGSCESSHGIIAGDGSQKLGQMITSSRFPGIFSVRFAISVRHLNGRPYFGVVALSKNSAILSRTVFSGLGAKRIIPIPVKGAGWGKLRSNGSVSLWDLAFERVP